MSTPQGTAPEVVPEPGWEPVKPFRLEGGRGSFVSGDPRGDRLRVSYFRRIDDGLLVGRAWFGPGAQGPPGHAHGGSIAAVLDEAMGAAAWLAGHLVVAVRLDTRFRKMLPLGTDTFLDYGDSTTAGGELRSRRVRDLRGARLFRLHLRRAQGGRRGGGPARGPGAPWRSRPRGAAPSRR